MAWRAITIAEFLMKEFVYCFGVPKEIHSEEDEILNPVFQELCWLLGVRTTVLYPQSDSMVEHYHQTIAVQLTMFVESHQKDWNRHVPLLLFLAYCSVVHESAKCTPARLMLGWDLRLPVDLMDSCSEVEEHTMPYVADYLRKLQPPWNLVYMLDVCGACKWNMYYYSQIRQYYQWYLIIRCHRKIQSLHGICRVEINSSWWSLWGLPEQGWIKTKD